MGVIKNSLCQRCNGDGRIPGEEIIEINIPSGVENGMILTCKGMGSVGIRNKPQGDINVYIEELSHPVYGRDGLDIIKTVVINKDTAIKGGKIQVETLDNDVIVTIPPGTKTGKLLRLKGKGIHSAINEELGDMILKIGVSKPSHWYERLRIND